MLFNSREFIAFFVIVFCLYCILSHRWQNRMLLGASFIFYGWWDWRFVFLMVFSATIDYVAAWKIKTSNQPAVRRRWLIGSITTNLLILSIFKYFQFFLHSALSLITGFGFHGDLWTLSIILPLG